MEFTPVKLSFRYLEAPGTAGRHFGNYLERFGIIEKFSPGVHKPNKEHYVNIVVETQMIALRTMDAKGTAEACVLDKDGHPIWVNTEAIVFDKFETKISGDVITTEDEKEVPEDSEEPKLEPRTLKEGEQPPKKQRGRPKKTQT